jgi:hypothetical protein
MSFGSTMQFLRTGSSSGCGPTAQPIAGRRTAYAGDVVEGHQQGCYPAGRARVPWGNFWGGNREPNSGMAGLSRADAIKHGVAGAVIKTRRGTVVQTRSGVAGLMVSSRVGSIPQTRGR